MGRRAAVVRLRVTARRPASWLALLLAAVATWWLADGPAPRWLSVPAAGWWSVAAAAVAGAVSAAAAIGGVPRNGGAADTAAWAACRGAWPAVGVLVTAATLGRAAATPAAGLLAAGAATVAAFVAAAQSGFQPVAVRRGIGGAVPPAVMASALAGMVGFLFLAPDYAWGYAALAWVWAVVSAVPRAARGFGADGEAARALLGATALGGRGWAAWTAVRIVAAHAAVLVWPPLVAVVLSGRTAEPALGIAVAIGGGAAALAAATAGVLAAGGSRETALALGLGVALAAAAWGTSAAPVGSPSGLSAAGLMLSDSGDPARLSGPRRDSRRSPSPRGDASCPDSPSPASARSASPRPASPA